MIKVLVMQHARLRSRFNKVLAYVALFGILGIEKTAPPQPH